MRADVKYALIAVFGFCALLVLGLSLTGPLLYTLEMDSFPSRFHDNTNALKMQSLNSTTDVLPLMEDLLGYTGPVVVSIRINDIGQARRDLELFVRSRGSLNSLIVKLDMSESEMQEFSKSKQMQQQLLTELLNSSVSLDELKNLEIRYRDENNPEMLMSVQYQGDALRKKIEELYTRYSAETGTVVAIGTKFGLDVTEEEEGLREFEEYVDEIGRDKKEQYIVPIRRTPWLSFLVMPDNGVYGDSIGCSGYYFSLYGYRVESVPDKGITVYLDNAPVSSTITDELGSYGVNIPIERIPAGQHTLYAQSGTTLSETQILTVHSVSSTTTLAVTRPNSNGDVTCTGTVTANRPVRSAPVQLVLDGTPQKEISTDAQGQFRETLRIPGGRHTLIARFRGEGFPITASESDPQVVDVSILRVLPADNSLGILLAAAVIILLFIGIAWYYLKRVPGRSAFALLTGTEPFPPPIPAGAMLLPDTEQNAPEPSPAPPTPTSPVPAESFMERYSRVLKDEGLSAAARVVYRQFAGVVARELQIPRHTTLTPRELSRSCLQRPFCGAFSSFVGTYELIRYGGRRSPAVQEEFERRMHAAGSEFEERSS